jgi:hypothetical protein
MADITVGDIENVLSCPSQGTGVLAVSVFIERIKGGSSGGSKTIIGNTKCIDYSSPLDTCNPVYWLNCYLKERLGCSLRELRPYLREHPERKRDRIWGWRPAALSVNFTKYLGLLGYPSKHFSFHSLRKGMLTNRVILDVSGTAGGVLERATVLGNWRLQSRSRDGYVTDSLSRVIVANSFGGNSVIPEMASVNGFHRLDLPDSYAKVSMITS